MKIDPALEAKIEHTADCRCGCRRVAFMVDHAANMGEKQFMAEVRRELNLKGWRSYHTHNSRKSDKGFPDLVAVRELRVVWIELKTATGEATAAQLNWIEDLRAAKQEVYLWRPADWAEIVAVLA